MGSRWSVYLVGLIQTGGFCYGKRRSCWFAASWCKILEFRCILYHGCPCTHSSTRAQAGVQSWQRDRWLGLGCGQRHGHRCRPCASDCLDHELVIAGIVLVWWRCQQFFFRGRNLITSCKGDCMIQRRKLQMIQMMQMVVVALIIQYLVLGCFRAASRPQQWGSKKAFYNQETR